VISDSPRSATGQFALAPANLFRSGDPASLADRIDAWIDDPAALEAASKTYARYGELYAVDRSVKAIERVYARAGRAPEKPAGYAGWIYRSLSSAFYNVVAIPLLFLLTRVILGARIEGKSHVPRAGGALTATAMFPRRPVFTSAPENLQHSVYGGLVRLLGAVPVPQTPAGLPLF